MKYLKGFFMAALLLVLAAAFPFVLAGPPAVSGTIAVSEQIALPQHVPEVLAMPAVLTFVVDSKPNVGPGSYRDRLCKWSASGGVYYPKRISDSPVATKVPMYPIRA